MLKKSYHPKTRKVRLTKFHVRMVSARMVEAIAGW